MTCIDCLNESTTIRHSIEVAEPDGESGYTVCLYPCGHEVYTTDQPACDLCEGDAA